MCVIPHCRPEDYGDYDLLLGELLALPLVLQVTEPCTKLGSSHAGQVKNVTKETS